jgi:hypothetical protein
MKMSKLKKMKMPEKKGMEKDEMEGMEMASESGEEMDMEEMPMEEESMGEEMASEEMPAPASDLEMVSDDDLMAELKKRGLMSQLDESAPEEEDEYSMPSA